MIILNNMYTGRYITQQGKLGHEIINLFKADDGKFYIWLNSMGVCTQAKADRCTVLMVRSISANLYKVLAKAENCQFCEGAKSSRARKNIEKEKEKAEKRYFAQKELVKKGATYNGKDPMDDIFKDKDMFATFYTQEVYEANGDVYITTEPKRENIEKGIYYVKFKRVSEAMRAYFMDEEKKAYQQLQDLIEDKQGKGIWKTDTTEKVKDQNTNVSLPDFNFFKLICKERDELSFSNALAYFIERMGIEDFLENCLKLDASYSKDNYELSREKNNIDISFWGDKNVVIIENKIDANITVDKKATIEKQIEKAVELYFPDVSKETEKELQDKLKSLSQKATGRESQLSKYYLYAMAYLLSKGVSEKELEKHIECFLLIPKYAEKQFEQDDKQRYSSDFMYGEKYKIITYKELYDYFEKKTGDKYLSDFISALTPLAREFNNEIEEDCKYRFFKAIGKI